MTYLSVDIIINLHIMTYHSVEVLTIITIKYILYDITIITIKYFYMNVKMQSCIAYILLAQNSWQNYRHVLRILKTNLK